MLVTLRLIQITDDEYYDRGDNGDYDDCDDNGDYDDDGDDDSNNNGEF